jgi:hypothetical protein
VVGALDIRALSLLLGGNNSYTSPSTAAVRAWAEGWRAGAADDGTLAAS